MRMKPFRLETAQFHLLRFGGQKILRLFPTGILPPLKVRSKMILKRTWSYLISHLTSNTKNSTSSTFSKQKNPSHTYKTTSPCNRRNLIWRDNWSSFVSSSKSLRTNTTPTLTQCTCLMIATWSRWLICSVLPWCGTKNSNVTNYSETKCEWLNSYQRNLN